MARARLLKPGFFTDDELGKLSPLTRLLFAGLWCIADRGGRLEDRPARIKVEVLPFDRVSVEGLLSKLAATGFVIRYSSGGKNYIQITNFPRHQSPHINEAQSTIPAPEGYGAEHGAEHPTSTAHSNSIAVPIAVPNSKTVAVAVAEGDFRRCCSAFEDCVGTVDAHTGKRIAEAIEDYGATCVIHCLEEASENGARNWKYASAIMKRHKTEGCYAPMPIANSAAPADPNFFEQRYAKVKGA